MEGEEGRGKKELNMDAGFSILPLITCFEGRVKWGKDKQPRVVDLLLEPCFLAIFQQSLKPFFLISKLLQQPPNNLNHLQLILNIGIKFNLNDQLKGKWYHTHLYSVIYLSLTCLHHSESHMVFKCNFHS